MPQQHPFRSSGTDAKGRIMRLAALALAFVVPMVAGGAETEPVSNWASPPPPASLPMVEGDPFAGIPNVEILYYDVGGKTAADLRRAMIRQGLRDPNDGSAVDALAEWRINWRWLVGGPGGCDLAAAETRFEATVRLPRLVEAPGLSQSLTMRWNQFLTGLTRHEANHIRNAWLASGEVLSAIQASDCANAEAAAQAAIAEIGKRDIEYDRVSKHGRLEGVVFP